MADGAETTVGLPGGPTLEGTPPAWPLNWSPDGTRLAFVTDRGAAMTTVSGWDVRVVGPARAPGATPPQAPVFLGDGTLAAMTGCCIGSDQQMAAFPTAGGEPTRLFAVPAPVRSIRRDRGGAGLWLTTEASGLWRWDGSTLRAVRAGAQITSG